MLECATCYLADALKIKTLVPVCAVDVHPARLPKHAVVSVCAVDLPPARFLNMLLCLSVQLIYIQHHQHHLMQHLSKLELEKGQLYGQLTDMKQKYASCSTENVRLQAQVQLLQQQFDQSQQQGQVQARGQGQGLPANQ